MPEASAGEPEPDGQGAPNWAQAPGATAAPSGAALPKMDGKYNVRNPGLVPPVDSFTAAGHEHLRHRSDATVNDYFGGQITDRMIDLVTECTEHNVEKHGCDEWKRFWRPLHRNEILCILGIVTFMGLVQLPAKHDYWAPEPFGCTIPVRNYMTESRFNAITRNLAFTMEEKEDQPAFGAPGFNKLWRIQTYLDMFNEAIQRAYTLGQYVCVDEMMLPFKGWSNIRTYASALQISVWYCRASGQSCLARSGAQLRRCESRPSATPILTVTRYTQLSIQ